MLLQKLLSLKLILVQFGVFSFFEYNLGILRQFMPQCGHHLIDADNVLMKLNKVFAVIYVS